MNPKLVRMVNADIERKTNALRRVMELSLVYSVHSESLPDNGVTSARFDELTRIAQQALLSVSDAPKRVVP